MNNIYSYNLNYNTQNIAFKGIFSPKSDKSDNLYYEENITLPLQGDSLCIQQDSIIIFRDKFKIDLTEKRMKSEIKHLREGESLVFGRKDFNPDDTTISRSQFELKKSKGKLYITNLSQFGTTFKLSKPTMDKELCDYLRMIKLQEPEKTGFVNLKPSYLRSVYGKKELNFQQIIEDKYAQIRYADYTPKSTFNTSYEEIANAVKTPPEVGGIAAQNEWNYRYFKKGINFIPTDRVSLNVKADPNLIKELDNLFIDGSYKDKKGNRFVVPIEKRNTAYYKTYKNASQWTERHDPITIYLDGEISPELLKALSDISEKYARKSPNKVPLLGALEGKPWIATEKEPQEQEFYPVWEKANKLNPNLAQAAYNKCYEGEGGKRKFIVSAAYFEAIKDLVAEYEEYLKIKK